MILFMIMPQNPSETPLRYTIPAVYQGDKITEKNVQIISWNEVDYINSEGVNISINNISLLKEAVFDAARNDALCCDINQQFLSEYKIDIFSIYKDPENKYNKIITNVFASWPHPIIGNVLVSTGIRPQTEDVQYVKNWESFPEKYMTVQTKKCIKYLIDNETKAGLSKLTKSGRDQVRVCKDMTELARAVMGEISTYATKKLEKIYALELCSSVRLLKAQRQLIRQVIFTEFYNVNLNKETKLEKPVTMKELFMAQWEYLKKPPLGVTEYIAFFSTIGCIKRHGNAVDSICSSCRFVFRREKRFNL